MMQFDFPLLQSVSSDKPLGYSCSWRRCSSKNFKKLQGFEILEQRWHLWDGFVTSLSGFFLHSSISVFFIINLLSNVYHSKNTIQL